MRHAIAPSSAAIVLAAVLALSALAPAVPAGAADVDGPDCGRVIHDFGDAPEGISIGFLGGVGHFPTCLAPGAPGTQQFTCPPRSMPPGLTGYMRHAQSGAANYWLGCVSAPGGLAGIDSEEDGKVSAGGAFSACNLSIAVDCVGSPYGMTFGQDECRLDDDAGVYADVLLACIPNAVPFSTANCGPERTAYLNILVDMNFDGDWNDNGPCSNPQHIACYVPCAADEPCAHEWAVKNAPILVPAGCGQQWSPAFRVSASEGIAWMRVSLTDEAVDDDYPWAGSANRPGGEYTGGETEDYVVMITAPDAVRSTTWGRLKQIYR